MSKELEGLAKNLTDAISGSGGKMDLQKVIGMFSTENGKRILGKLLADGGEKVRHAAVGAKSGDMSGVQSIIASVAETEEGRKLLDEIMNGAKGK